MSTNYYLRPPGACAEQCDNWPHLGQLAFGWDFAFQATETVRDFAAWKAQLDGGEIYDEYGSPVTKDELLALIEKVRGRRSVLVRSDYHDADGNRFISGYFS